MCLLIKRPLPPTCPVLSYSLPESTAPFPPLPAAPCACCLLHWLMVHCICLVVFRRSCLCWRLWKCSWALTICTRCPSLSRVLRCSPTTEMQCSCSCLNPNDFFNNSSSGIPNKHLSSSGSLSSYLRYKQLIFVLHCSSWVKVWFSWSCITWFLCLQTTLAIPHIWLISNFIKVFPVPSQYHPAGEGTIGYPPQIRSFPHVTLSTNPSAPVKLLVQ